jgi:hypothetical protein
MEVGAQTCQGPTPLALDPASFHPLVASLPAQINQTSDVGCRAKRVQAVQQGDVAIELGRLRRQFLRLGRELFAEEETLARVRQLISNLIAQHRPSFVLKKGGPGIYKGKFQTALPYILGEDILDLLPFM